MVEKNRQYFKGKRVLRGIFFTHQNDSAIIILFKTSFILLNKANINKSYTVK